MKTLFVSDLDGTLLRSTERISQHSCDVINRLTERGMTFSYATARSAVTARKVTEGLTARLPIIVYNGAFVIDSLSGEMLSSVFFGREAEALLGDLLAHGVVPIVYAYIGGEEKFSFVPGKCSKGTASFVLTRTDSRNNPVDSVKALADGDIFYFSCIDEPEKLFPLYEKYRESFHCVYQRDIYSGDQWLEIMPKETSKSNAVRRLMKLTGCERLVVFGDGRNDIDMFRLADEAYAVSNAHEDLKAHATGIIASNDEDGVAAWLEENFERYK